MIDLVAGRAPFEAGFPDTAAFTSQLEAALASAHRLATVMLRDRTAAEDAVQEAALKAWRKRGQLRGGAAGFRTWFPFHRRQRVPDGATGALVAGDQDGRAA